MMKTLNRMLLREIIQHMGLFIAASVVVFSGITLFAATYMAYCNMNNSLNAYYRQYRFLDYYAEALNIPEEVIPQVKRIAGVGEVIGRFSEDVGADMTPDRRVTLRMISVPDHRKPAINDLFIAQGGYLDRRPDNACLIGKKFAEFYKLHKGDRINVIANLRTHEFKIAGIVESPEYIFTLKSASSLSTSGEDFGVIYVKESVVREIFGFHDAYNQLLVRFESGVSQHRTIERIETMLKPYGFISGTQRKDQVSHTMVTDDIHQLQGMAYAFPALFLSAAALMIYIILRRLVNKERTLIGVMKAMGYTDARILVHYQLQSLVIAVGGVLPAIVAGTWLGGLLTQAYTTMDRIPVMNIRIYGSVFVIGSLISLGFCLFAGYHAVKKVLEVQPAQAMRPETPPMGRRIVLERVGPIWNRLSFGWKMSIRNLFRSRQRTLFTMIGFMFTIILFVTSIFLLDCIDYVIRQQFFVLQRQDYKVSFTKACGYQDTLALKDIRGVLKVEPIMEVPAEIKNGWLKESIPLVGLPENNSFYHLVDTHLLPVKVPENGMLISHVLAQRLQIRVGDDVEVKTGYLEIKKKKIRIVGLVKTYAGFSGYMRDSALGALMEKGKFATGALIRVRNGLDSHVRKELLKMPNVETVESRLGTYQSFVDLTQMINFFVGVMILFGGIMGFAIIFNTTLINIAERYRELASLKVLGYTGWEIQRTLFRENLLLGLVSLIPGLLVGRMICGVLAQVFSNKVIALELVIYPRTYLITAASLMLFILMALAANRRNIVGLDMVEVLKNREG